MAGRTSRSWVEEAQKEEPILACVNLVRRSDMSGFVQVFERRQWFALWGRSYGRRSKSAKARNRGHRFWLKEHLEMEPE
jgi:hypothetical protein